MTDAPAGVAHPRTVRSFVRREGRMSPAQKRALDAHWPHWGLEPTPGLLDLDAAFGRRAPRVLEIGFGTGDVLASMALAHPERDYLGIDVFRTGAASLFQKLAAQGSSNVRVLCTDAVEVLKHSLAPASLAAAYVLFPDPWPKKRHHKRRLIQPEFAALLASRLQPDGLLHLATDWDDYAQQMLAVLDAEPQLTNLYGAGHHAPRLIELPESRYERRGTRLGHGLWSLSYRKGT